MLGTGRNAPRAEQLDELKVPGVHLAKVMAGTTPGRGTRVAI